MTETANCRAFSEQEFQSVKNSINLWIPEFKASAGFPLLSAAEQQQADMVVIVFSQLMYVTFLMSPAQWDAMHSRKCALDVMPLKLTAGDDYWITVENSLISFMKFCAARGYVPLGNEIAPALEGITGSLMAPADDSEQLQRLADDMLKEEKEEHQPMRNFMKRHAAEVKKMALNGKAGVISTPGRNDPCSCGSGKKYKKCCGIDQ
ncbi:MAG: SEC-C domain-containing protein [Spirochaetia bacterium]|jgi:hypothetical protein|nr:SEC-C domain-containing protein [Spirochaetia bacterium]